MAVHPLLLAGTAFVASAVEAVEAVTIVLAVGYTQGWASALRGAAWACAALAAIIVVTGPALVHFVPLGALQLVIGLFLILFGFTWLRKAIWRACGRKALHDESAIFAREVEALKGAGEERIGFVTSFNGVLVEGLEIAIIVVTLGAAAGGSFAWASIGAAAAALAVIGIAIVLRRPFSRVPENLMKFVVGIMLLSFGTYWAGEGVGIDWPFRDAALLGIIAIYGLLSAALVALLRRLRPATA
ncbi:MAG: hypothetical protein JO233_02445 [Candidatus Eremiobacteraeota bacterium]|nr:hypothetical protein [Candidatus Eremiobacteraeota bacterium]